MATAHRQSLGTVWDTTRLIIPYTFRKDTQDKECSVSNLLCGFVPSIIIDTNGDRKTSPVWSVLGGEDMYMKMAGRLTDLNFLLGNNKGVPYKKNVHACFVDQCEVSEKISLLDPEIYGVLYEQKLLEEIQIYTLHFGGQIIFIPFKRRDVVVCPFAFGAMERLRFHLNI